ncbi:MAG: hypothetical protein ACOZB3_04125 [Calditrichota bacterium]
MKHRLLIICLIFSVVFVLWSCSEDDEKELIIPEAAQQYAGTREAANNFNYRAYLWWEYWIAQDSIRNGQRAEFNGTFDEWLQLPWSSNSDSRSSHLPEPFTHDVLIDSEYEYFKMIGLYLNQFGWGWRDTYNGGAGGIPNDTSAWNHTLSGILPDNPATLEFDGESDMREEYRSMWINDN